MPDEPQFRTGHPEACFNCGYTGEDMLEAHGIAWIMLGEPGTLFLFYQCAHCHALSGNIHAVENTKILLKEREEAKNKAPIIKPKSNLIILPGNNGGH